MKTDRIARMHIYIYIIYLFGMKLIQTQIKALSAATGLDEASTKIITCLVLSFPFSFLYKRLPDRSYKLKHIYIISVSAFFLFGVSELYNGFRTLFISSFFTYIITKYWKSKMMPWFNLAFLMAHLASNHFYYQFFNTYDSSQMDITGAQMVLVMKLSSFAWSYHDGQSYLFDREAYSRLNVFQKSRIVIEHPSFLSFMGFTFFYPSLLTGPAFDYADYHKFVNTDLFQDVPGYKRPGKTKKRKIPRSGRVALWKVTQGLLWAAAWILCSPHIGMNDLFSSHYSKHGFLWRCVHLYVLGFTYRLKYYAVWLISEGGCILVGIGYNGYNEEKKKFYWNRVQNIDPLTFELGQNCFTCLEAWNQNTNKWLKNFIYLRTARVDNKTGKLKVGFLSSLLTFATSAFWHGTRPGYYLSFITGAFLQALGKIYRRNLRPLFISKDGTEVSPFYWCYNVACWINTQLVFGYLVQPFVILDWNLSLRCWRQVYFYVHIIIALTLFIFSGPYAKSVKKVLSKHHKANKVEPVKEPIKEPVEEPIRAPAKKPYQLSSENASTTSLVPEYDSQTELKSPSTYMLPELDDLKNDYELLQTKAAEWKERTKDGKDVSFFDEEEKRLLSEAFNHLNMDIRHIFDAEKTD